MKRSDLKEISDNEFLAVLGMMQNEYFLDDFDKFDVGSQIDILSDLKSKGEKELITDDTGQGVYLLNFSVYIDVKNEYADFDPYDSGWCDVLEAFSIDEIELFDLEENQINTTAEQRMKMATIIQERLTMKN
jgi:hypothetical protein